MRPVREMPVKSVLAWPEAGARLALSEPITVFGFAWSGFGEIASVEFSHDDGQTWRVAELLPPPSALAWTRWQANWTPTTGGRASSPCARRHGRQYPADERPAQPLRLPDERH